MIHREQPSGLSLQEYLDAERRLSPGEFFVWQSPPTVIYGRNQVLENEVNLAFCREKGIAVVQRRSGGGCVYSDPGNVMVSFVVEPGPVEEIFPRMLGHVAGFLRSLGLDAEVSGHNDILVGGRKVSGNAYYKTPGTDIVHGTLMFDVDLDALENAIRPPAEKLQRHGVASVRQRVANLKPLLEAAGNPMDISRFKFLLAAWLESVC